MHTVTRIHWDDVDPFPMGKRIEEAFNRVMSFCPELQSKEERKTLRPPELTAFNSVVGGDFDRESFVTLGTYAVMVYERVKEKYENSSDPLRESVIQAGYNVAAVMKDTADYLFERLPK